MRKTVLSRFYPVDIRTTLSVFGTLCAVLALAAPSLAQTQEPTKEDLKTRWQEARAAGRQAFERGQFEEARPLISRAFALAHRFEDGERLATSMADMADLARATARYAEAEGFYNSALGIRERIEGGNSPNLIPLLDGAGWSLYSQAKMKEAAAPFRRSLAIMEQAKGKDSIEIIPAILNLSRPLQIMKADAEVVANLERIIAIRSAVRGPGNPEVAADIIRLARHHVAEKRDAAAEPLFISALNILERANGALHTSVTAPLDELGLLYSRGQRWTDAEPVFRRSVTVRELSLGPLNPELAPALENLAAVWIQLGRFADAEGAYRRALELWTFQLGPGHPNLATVMDRIGHACASQKKYDEAESAYRSALWIRDRQSVTNLNNLALIVAARERPADAEPFYKVALMVLEPPAAAPTAKVKPVAAKSAEASGPKDTAHPDLLRITLHNYAELMRSTNRPASAKRLDVREKRAEALEKRMLEEAAAKAKSSTASQ